MIVKSGNYVSKKLYLNLKYGLSSSFLHSKLNQIFEDEQFVMKLSYKTRILPNYFSSQCLNEFQKSKKFNEYSRYVNKRRNMDYDEETRDCLDNQIFKHFPAYKQWVHALDCYMDWLTDNKLKKNSNEYFKNKCTMEMFDIRNPQNWFTNNTKRHFIYHHGPTNSGKTSSAIKELKDLPKDKKGVYMAPLRLLAWEMQQKLENCNLITGQDKQFRVSNLTSCTIEAFNQNEDYDVAIIDEIQMIGDPERGWSWTKALVSSKAKRIHLCGDERAIGLVSKLVQQLGGTLEEKRYSRLGKLKLIPKIFDISKIQEGDCMIQFSVQTLHKLRRKIKDELQRREKQKKTQNQLTEPQTNSQEKPCSKVAMVYGRLPPECRKEQARKFNANIAPYLVATNAIGMGLNLNIKKIIFAGIKRRNSKGDEVDLEEHEIQQIAGRAGRGLNDGLVQCASYEILRKVRKALRNVNKTYGLNLEDDQSSDEIKQLTNDEDDQDNAKSEQVSRQSLQNYDAFLKRKLTQKERRIEKAGLFIEYIFLKRMMLFLQQHYGMKVNLGDSLKMHLNLALKSEELYFLSDKLQLSEWIEKLEKNYKLETRDTFQIAKALSMHYNSPFARQKMAYFASKFQQKKVVNLPKKNIEARSQKKMQNFLKLDILQSNYSVIEVYINLWNKYEFIFWDIQEAKKLKEQTSNLIKQVLEDEQGFDFYRSKKIKGKKFKGTEENQESEEKVEMKQTLLDETASDIEQIKI